MLGRRKNLRQIELTRNSQTGSAVGTGLVSLLAAVALALLAGCVTPVSPAPRVAPEGLSTAQYSRAKQNLRIFDTVWDTVNRKYYDAKFQGVDWGAAAVTYGPKAVVAKDDAELYGALNAMLGLLHDGHTGAYTPAQAKDYHTQERAMTGFRLLRVGERWAVDEVLPGSPAEGAGVKPGWIVLARDGRPLGEKLQLPVLRGGEAVQWDFLDTCDQPVALTLTARRVSIALHEERLLPGGIVHLRFDEFDWSKMHWLSKQLKLHRNAPGVVIDLRRNPGGTLLALDFMVGEFFDRSFSYAVSVKRSGERHRLRAMTLGSARYNGRVAVLVDHVSGSAAEIFAAALQEKHRATIIGRLTGGAVLSAKFRKLPAGGLLEYSTRDLLTEQGRRLEGNGVIPDITAPQPTLADLRAGRDPDLETALRILAQP
jgi:carboxyl-terminal processing protease